MVFLTKLKPEPMGVYSLSTAYGVNSLVMSEDGAAANISVQDVPAGTPLSNTEYWKVHTDLSAVRQSAETAAQAANAAAGNVQGNIAALDKKIYRSSYEPTFGNGTLGNMGNSSGIAMKEIAPTYGAKSLVVSINKDAGEGFYWVWQYRAVKQDSGVSQTNAPGFSATNTAYSESYAHGANSFRVSMPDGTKGFAIGLLKKGTDGSYVSLQSEEYYNGAISVRREFADEDVEALKERVAALEGRIAALEAAGNAG